MSLTVDNDIINCHLVHFEYIKYMKQRCVVPAGPSSETLRSDPLKLQIATCRACKERCGTGSSRNSNRIK